MKDFIKTILPRWLKIGIIEHRYMFKIIKINYKDHLKKLLKDNKGKSLSIDDERKWVKKLNKLAYSNSSYISLGEEFASSEIKIIKNIEIHEQEVIAICVAKNDFMKLKNFIYHHRKIGITKFIILDNDSNDGSIEWLEKQNDVILLQTKMKYSSIRRVAWINRIIAHYGDNRWYLVADSDELLEYNDFENKTIYDVIEYCKSFNIIRVRALMLDMYAKPQYYAKKDIESCYDECIYFDKNSYFLNKREDFINICGGPRERVFKMIPCLTKYPLFYFRKKDIHCKSHFLYPFKENFDGDCLLVLKHYKFLPGEIKKYREIAKNENYYKGSWAYKKYLSVMEKNNILNFMNDDTCKYEDSSSLDNILVYKKINWNKRGI